MCVIRQGMSCWNCTVYQPGTSVITYTRTWGIYAGSYLYDIHINIIHSAYKKDENPLFLVLNYYYSSPGIPSSLLRLTLRTSSVLFFLSVMFFAFVYYINQLSLCSQLQPFNLFTTSAATTLFR